MVSEWQPYAGMHSTQFKWTPNILLLGVILMTFAIQSTIADEDELENVTCANSFYLLERSLLKNPENRLSLLRTFFPAESAHPVVIRVNYTFKATVNVSQVWFWSESEFYLIQPLEIFQYSSLFFSNLPYRQTSMSLVLTEDCANAGVEYMHLLTQRLKLYAQSSTTSPDASTATISDSYVAVAANIASVKADQLQTDFVKFWLHFFLIVFPLGTILMLYLCDPIQLLLGDKTWQTLEDEHSHSTIAALIQISVVFTIYVFIMDWLGFAATITGHYLTQSNAAYYLTTTTGLLVDLAAFSWVMYVLATCCHWDCKNFWHRWKKQQQCNRGMSERIKKLMSSIVLAPMLCVANHVHYIVLAFVSDPYHAGSVGIAYGLSFLVHYFIFRQFYNRVVLRTDVRIKSTTSSHQPVNQVMLQPSFDQPDTSDLASNASSEGPYCKRRPLNRTPFNTQIVIVGLVLISPVILLYEAVIIVLFMTLPISKTLEDSPTRLYTIYQGTGVLIVLLLTYSILLRPNPFSLPRTVSKIANVLRLPERTPNWNRLCDEEKCAHVVTALVAHPDKELQLRCLDAAGDQQADGDAQIQRDVVVEMENDTETVSNEGETVV